MVDLACPGARLAPRLTHFASCPSLEPERRSNVCTCDTERRCSACLVERDRGERSAAMVHTSVAETLCGPHLARPQARAFARAEHIERLAAGVLRDQHLFPAAPHREVYREAIFQALLYRAARAAASVAS